MPVCRNCGARLTKFDKDICPVCGTKKPLEGVTSDTVEMTSFIDMENNKDFRVKKRTTMLFFAFVAGFTGLPFFYLHDIKKGVICASLNVIFFVTSIILFAVVLGVNALVATVLNLITMYFVNSLVGIELYFTDSLKDGYGEFVR